MSISERAEERAMRGSLPTDSAERKEAPMAEGLLYYFPAALAAVARVSKVGNDKHNPGQPLHHARGKSMDHADCILRHLVDVREDRGHGVGIDENGMPEVAYLAWRALALCQEWLEQHAGAPLAPNARVDADLEPGEHFVTKGEKEKLVAEAHAFQLGDHVEHINHPEWGVGDVVARVGGSVRVVYPDVASRLVIRPSNLRKVIDLSR